MPYLHILNYHGTSNEVHATQSDNVEGAVREYLGLLEDGTSYYDAVMTTIYEKEVTSRTLHLRDEDGKVVLEAILTNSPVRATYVPRELISWEVRQWDVS